MIQVIGIGGAPATGKTTLMRRVLRGLVTNERQLVKRHGKIGPIRFSLHENQHALVLGDYRDLESRNAGGDCLPDDAPQRVISYLLWLNRLEKYNGWSILFEGDRLFTGKLLQACEDADCQTVWVVLQVDRLRRWSKQRMGQYDHLGERRDAELARREQKVEAIAESRAVWSLVHHAPEDTEAIAQMLSEHILQFFANSRCAPTRKAR